MNEHTSAFVSTLACILALLVSIVVFAVTGDHTHAGEALAALAGFVGSSAVRAPRVVQAAATIGLAGIVAVAASGCTGAQAVAVLKPTCAAIGVLHSACAIVEPATSGDTP